MSDPNTSKGLEKVAEMAYPDLLQPMAKELGQQLVVVSKAVGMALAPLAAMVWGYDKIREYLNIRVPEILSAKSPEGIITPDPIVAGPIVSSLVFVANSEHLREMYAKLLASAMHRDTAGVAHPAFAHVIRELSPVEARLVSNIAENGLVTLGMERNKWTNANIESVWYRECERARVPYEEREFVYANLQRLGIIRLKPDSFGDGDGTLVVSQFGIRFINACVSCGAFPRK